jgi:hypothetical protein
MHVNKGGKNKIDEFSELLSFMFFIQDAEEMLIIE